MIVWQLFGLWAIGCLVWENHIAFLGAVAAICVSAYVYITGSLLFGGWWPLIVPVYAGIGLTVPAGMARPWDAIKGALALGLIAIAPSSLGEFFGDSAAKASIWDVFGAMTQIMSHNGALK